jgi:diguanylate cyclase (GGDEF)-like protein/putative nucleotidyltransferase with HDIG domain
MDRSIPIRVQAFVILTAVPGVAVLIGSCLQWHTTDMAKFFGFLLIALLSSTMKVKLPGMDSTMSVHFLFVLVGMLELSLPQTLVVGCAAALLQSVWKTKQGPDALKVVFNVFSNTSNAIFVSYVVYHIATVHLKGDMPLLLLLTSCTYFFINTILVSIVIALSEKRSLRGLWMETYFWSLPYYMVGACLAGILHLSDHLFGWQNVLLFMPIMFGIYRSYQMYLDRLDEQRKRAEVEEQQAIAEKRHVEQVCALHLRTIEGLALAIDAKDHTTHQHLHRVRTYAVEIGKELELGEQEMDALRAAALMHDVGKLAVPDHIVNKPGRLTHEEFEKMKIHPVVGADILERVSFPYPVAPIVRAHHEKWDGSGYPDGLKGEEIPIGARILAVADCLDALASDRPYRKAVTLDEAVKHVVERAGISFDPKVVEIVKRRYLELESFAVRSLEESRGDSFDFNYKVDRGAQPDNGFALDPNYRRTSHADFLSSIASARQEAYTLFELSQDLGNSLSLNETLSLFAMRLRKLVPYDSIVAFIPKDGLLVPEFVSGDNFRTLSSLAVPMGEGLCGWVAQNSKPIINGDPTLEAGFANAPKTTSDLRSALVVPLAGLGGMVGILALYRAEPDAFTSDHLRVLEVITSKVALFIENALKYRQAESSATIDYLTGLPNARALSLHLEQELARCKRENSTLAVLECDLNEFKLMNDSFGHLAGDKVLKLFADSLREVCRGCDFAARMGGDEIVIIVPDIPLDSVNEKAILLNKLAEHAGWMVCGENLLSLSLGAAFYPQDGAEADQLLAVADRNMYAAKKHYYANRELSRPGAPKRPYLVSVA